MADSMVIEKSCWISCDVWFLWYYEICNEKWKQTENESKCRFV